MRASVAAVLRSSTTERLLIGEMYLPLERLVRYYGDDGDGLHLPFNFQLIALPLGAPRRSPR